VVYPDNLNASYFLVDKNAYEIPEKIAIYYKDKKITYKSLAEDVNRFGNALKGLGIKKGDRFVCRMPNRPEAVISLLAGIKIGAIPVPSFSFLREKELEYIVNISDSMGIISNSENLDEIKDLRRRCSTLKWIVAIGDHELADNTYENLIKSNPSSLEPEKTKKDDIATLCFTSGTTGKPKGLPHKHQSLLIAADINVPFSVGGLKEGDIIFSTNPLGFSFGLSVLVYYPFRFGVSAVYSDMKMGAEEVFKTLEKFRVTHFFTVPTMCQKMLNVTDTKNYDLSSLRVIKLGGMPTPIELQRRWKATYGTEILPGFGMQEFVGSAISNQPENFKYGSIGLAQTNCETRVLDKNDHDVATGQRGRLAIKIPCVITYYWKDPEKTKQYLTKDGWLYTDDIVYQDEDGFFYHIGRSDDVIISSGWTISPAEIEEVMRSHKKISDVAAFGVISPEKGSIPVAAVVLKDGVKGSDDLTDDLKRFVKQKLAPYKCPRKIYFKESLPRTMTGKVLRYKLRQEVEDEIEIH